MGLHRRNLTAIERDWLDRANCAGIDSGLFFDQAHETEAKAICAGCEVRAECLHVAIELQAREGIWGGEDWTARRRIVRERQKAARSAR